MEFTQPSRVWRILALFAVLLNASFGYFYPMLPLGLPDMKTASDAYPNLFTPAPYAFAIWGLIYLAWLLYAIFTLFPSQRRHALHDRLCRPLILVNILASVWIIEFAKGYILISLLIIVAMLATGVALYLRSRQGTHSGWIRFPFSLFLGWITVATLANSVATLVSFGWRGGSLSEPLWAILLIAVALVLGLILGTRYRDPIYTLVIAWAVTAIGVKQQGMVPPVAVTAFAAAVILTIASGINGFRSLRPPRRE